MQTFRNPAKSRPLSANVKRLMRLARASPQNSSVIKVERQLSARDLAYCHKQGNLFMEAASMGFSMEDFAPRFMVELGCWETVRATLAACRKEMQVRLAVEPEPPILNNARME